MKITIFSFGYKHGPADADTVFDMRFLPNPYWVPELKDGTGLDRAIYEYVMKSREAKDFFADFSPVLLTYIENHVMAGRDSMRLAVGCTGGRHRSVAVTEYLRDMLNNGSSDLTVFHRDIDKE